MQRIAIISAIATLVVCGQAASQSKPDFSGEWSMNAGASDFGGMPAPSKLTEKIVHEEPALEVAIAQSGDFGDLTAEFTFTTDGTECLNKVADTEVKSTLKWDGPVLVVHSTMDVQGGTITMTDRWSLSEDGKTTTIARHVNGPMGAGDARIVLDRQ